MKDTNATHGVVEPQAVLNERPSYHGDHREYLPCDARKATSALHAGSLRRSRNRTIAQVCNNRRDLATLRSIVAKERRGLRV